MNNLLQKIIIVKSELIAYCRCCEKEFENFGNVDKFIQDHSFSKNHVKALTQVFLKNQIVKNQIFVNNLTFFDLDKALYLKKDSKKQLQTYLSQKVEAVLITFNNLGLDTVDCYKPRLLLILQFLVSENSDSLNVELAIKYLQKTKNKKDFAIINKLLKQGNFAIPKDIVKN